MQNKFGNPTLPENKTYSSQTFFDCLKRIRQRYKSSALVIQILNCTISDTSHVTRRTFWNPSEVSQRYKKKKINYLFSNRPDEKY